MKKLIWWAMAVMALMTSGCFTKGPYYIYGDYIEGQHEGEDSEQAEAPHTQSP
jgi:predicted small lipoprotein YifL